ncbi:DUF5017 domain-containing protein [Aridibaculum aurantiacum]|uniref:DUF5017 domain-containing protein n=1 Tax=Aridibaculum aurantiacum TaxID=2810307 RepID=UPI001A957438|nr:DUF5017 domain-containing protein [Aridibaculum aurantiacum]
MKKKYLNIGLSIAVVATMTACTKYDALVAPDDFQVTTEKTTYKVGDSVIFNFNTGPNQITFYSGEMGKRYENRERTMMAGNPKLVFQTSMQQGLLANPDSLQLLVSTNLRGYDSANIVNATWTNITSRNTKWPTTLATTYVTSDSISLADFNDASSVHIAFRVKNNKYATSAQRKWNVQNLNLTNFLPDGTNSFLFNNFANTGWVQASLKNNSTPGFMAWNVGEGGFSSSNNSVNSHGITIRSAYPITFDPGTATNVDENDDWLITSPVDLKTVRRDVGVTIKNDINGAFNGFTYVYNNEPGIYAKYLYFFRTPGVYNVTFVAGNYNNDKQHQVVKHLQLTITP